MKLWYEVDDAELIPSPSLLVYPERIESNLQHLIQRVGSPRKLRPHVKTHKMPQIVQMKLSLGITKFKVSTIAEAEMTARAGGEDVLIAYPIVGPNLFRVMRLIEELPDTLFSVIVDNLDSANQLQQTAHAYGVRIAVYLDLDVGMGRTGIEPGDRAMDLYYAMHRMLNLNPVGFHIYDGHITGLDRQRLSREIERVFEPVWRMRDEIDSRGLMRPTIVAGGTPTSIELARHDDVEVGAGTVALWDDGQDQLSPDLGFVPAAILLSRVVSHPRGNFLCLDLGHKAIASEMPVPRATLLGFDDVRWINHNEEHMVIHAGDVNDHPIGSIVYAVPKHVCPTVALHGQVGVVQQNRLIDQWPIAARNRIITI